MSVDENLYPDLTHQEINYVDTQARIEHLENTVIGLLQSIADREDRSTDECAIYDQQLCCLRDEWLDDLLSNVQRDRIAQEHHRLELSRLAEQRRQALFNLRG